MQMSSSPRTILPMTTLLPKARSTDTILSPEEQAEVERLLSERLVEGFCLLERACPACTTPLVKKQAPSSTEKQNNNNISSKTIMNATESLISINTMSSVDSTVPMAPVPGVAYCVKCQAHVVSEAAEVELLESHNDTARKKGTILVVSASMDNDSENDNDGSIQTKENDMSVNTGPEAEVTVATLTDEDEVTTIGQSYQREEFEVMLARTEEEFCEGKSLATTEPEYNGSVAPLSKNNAGSLATQILPGLVDSSSEVNTGSLATVALSTESIVTHQTLTETKAKLNLNSSIAAATTAVVSSTGSVLKSNAFVMHQGGNKARRRPHRKNQHLQQVMAPAGQKPALWEIQQARVLKVVEAQQRKLLPLEGIIVGTPPTNYATAATNSMATTTTFTTAQPQPQPQPRQHVAMEVEEIEVIDYNEDISLLAMEDVATVPQVDRYGTLINADPQQGNHPHDEYYEIVEPTLSHETAVDLAIQRSESLVLSSTKPDAASVVIDFPMPEFKIRRELAIKMLAAKMVQGFSIKNEQCGACNMPLMHINNSSEPVECFVCRAIRKKYFKEKAEVEAKKQSTLQVSIEMLTQRLRREQLAATAAQNTIREQQKEASTKSLAATTSGAPRQSPRDASSIDISASATVCVIGKDVSPPEPSPPLGDKFPIRPTARGIDLLVVRATASKEEIITGLAVSTTTETWAVEPSLSTAGSFIPPSAKRCEELDAEAARILSETVESSVAANAITDPRCFQTNETLGDSKAQPILPEAKKVFVAQDIDESRSIQAIETPEDFKAPISSDDQQEYNTAEPHSHQEKDNLEDSQEFLFSEAQPEYVAIGTSCTQQESVVSDVANPHSHKTNSTAGDSTAQPVVITERNSKREIEVARISDNARDSSASFDNDPSTKQNKAEDDATTSRVYLDRITMARQINTAPTMADGDKKDHIEVEGRSYNAAAPSASELFLERWAILRSEARSVMTRRMIAGWAVLSQYCLGDECNNFPLISKGREKRCVVCGGSGSGDDAVYRYAFPNQLNQSKNEVADECDESVIPSKQHSATEIRKVPTSPIRTMSLAERTNTFESKRDAVRKEIGKRTMKGWTLLDRTCPRCVMPLMTDTSNCAEICVLCGIVGKLSAEIAPKLTRSAPSQQDSSTESRQRSMSPSKRKVAVSGKRAASVGTDVHKTVDRTDKLPTTARVPFEAKPKDKDTESRQRSMSPSKRKVAVSDKRDASVDTDVHKPTDSTRNLQVPLETKPISADSATLTKTRSNSPGKLAKGSGALQQAVKQGPLTTKPISADSVTITKTRPKSPEKSAKGTDASKRTVKQSVDSVATAETRSKSSANSVQASKHADKLSATSVTHTRSKSSGTSVPDSTESKQAAKRSANSPASAKTRLKSPEKITQDNEISKHTATPSAYSVGSTETSSPGKSVRGSKASKQVSDQPSTSKTPQPSTKGKESPRKKQVEKQVPDKTTKKATSSSAEAKRMKALTTAKDISDVKNEPSIAKEKDVALTELNGSRKKHDTDSVASLMPWIVAYKNKESDSSQRSDPPASNEPPIVDTTIRRLPRAGPPERSRMRREISPDGSRCFRARSCSPVRVGTPDISQNLTGNALELSSDKSRSEKSWLLTALMREPSSQGSHYSRLGDAPEKIEAVRGEDSRFNKDPDVLGLEIPRNINNNGNEVIRRLIDAATTESPRASLEINTSARGAGRRIPSPGLSVANLPLTLPSPSPSSYAASTASESKSQDRRSQFSANGDRKREPSPELCDASVTTGSRSVESRSRRISNNCDRNRASSPGLSAAPILVTYSSSSSVYTTASSSTNGSTPRNRPRVTPETPGRSRLHPSPRKPGLPSYLPGNPNRSKSVPDICPVKFTSPSIDTAFSKPGARNTDGHVHGRAVAIAPQVSDRSASKATTWALPRKEGGSSVIDVEPLRKQAYSSIWREGRDEIIIVDRAFNDSRQDDIAESDTLDALLSRIEKTKSELAKATNDQYGPGSQYRLRGLIDNLARAAEQMQQIDQS